MCTGPAIVPDYSTHRPCRRLRWFRLAAVILGPAILALLVLRFPQVLLKAKLLHLQRQCLRHSVQPGTLVYSEQWLGLSQRTPCPVAFPKQPAYYDSFRSIAGLTARRLQDPIVFLHERRNRTGQRRLVAVSVPAGYTVFVLGSNYNAWVTIDLKVAIVAPSGLLGSPIELGRASVSLGIPTFRQVREVELLAGAADSSDPSHFTIGYRVGQESGTIHGWLRDNSIDFDVRDSSGKLLYRIVRGVQQAVQNIETE